MRWRDSDDEDEGDGEWEGGYDYNYNYDDDDDYRGHDAEGWPSWPSLRLGGASAALPAGAGVCAAIAVVFFVALMLTRNSDAPCRCSLLQGAPIAPAPARSA
jgi:hypothetical protein